MGSTAAETVIEEHRVALRDGVLHEVVIFRLEGRVPVAAGGTDAVGSEKHGLGLRRRLLGAAEGGGDVVRFLYFRELAEGKRVVWSGLARAGDSEKVFEVEIVAEFGPVEGNLFPFGVDWDHVVVAVGFWWVVG